KPGPDTTWFFAALSFLPAIEPRETAEQLQKRVRHLESEVQTYKQVLTDLVPRIGRLPLIEVEYALAMRSAEREWVEQIIKDLRTGKLDWSPAVVRKHAAHLFDNCQSPDGPNQTLKKSP